MTSPNADSDSSTSVSVSSDRSSAATSQEGLEEDAFETTADLVETLLHRMLNARKDDLSDAARESVSQQCDATCVELRRMSVIMQGIGNKYYGLRKTFNELHEHHTDAKNIIQACEDEKRILVTKLENMEERLMHEREAIQRKDALLERICKIHTDPRFLSALSGKGLDLTGLQHEVDNSLEVSRDKMQGLTSASVTKVDHWQDGIGKRDEANKASQELDEKVAQLEKEIDRLECVLEDKRQTIEMLREKIDHASKSHTSRLASVCEENQQVKQKREQLDQFVSLCRTVFSELFD